jgi:hypothetical protein
VESVFTSGQSELVSAIIFIGIALIIGTTMLAYVNTMISSYREQVNLLNFLQQEASNIFINTISFDSSSNTLWILLKKLDGSGAPFFIAVDDGSRYLSCSSIKVYNPVNDDNGIVCDTDSDCLASSTVFSSSLSKVYTVREGQVISFQQYAARNNFTISSPINICRVENECALREAKGLCNENTIVRIDLGESSNRVRILIATMYNGVPYIVGFYEVMLR